MAAKTDVLKRLVRFTLFGLGAFGRIVSDRADQVLTITHRHFAERPTLTATLQFVSAMRFVLECVGWRS